MTDTRLVQLDIGQWAWEFLRRNPDYQADYRDFMAIWRALEADYGSPPNRDFHRWKQDPRASRPAWDPEQSTGAACTTEDEERQMIECWMGAKWGFYQFPQDPSLAAWELASPINWRPTPGFRFDRAADAETDAQPVFDLSLPLLPQLEAAKHWLIGRQAALRKKGLNVPRTLQNQRAYWTNLLEALDAQRGSLLEEARTMSRSGYRTILQLQAFSRSA